ncbi:hypothetical protein HRbin38_00438 [bacterium HR38]|nr:hypothetical protein HRbin38_00438 [bacterium HR38]
MPFGWRRSFPSALGSLSGSSLFLLPTLTALLCASPGLSPGGPRSWSFTGATTVPWTRPLSPWKGASPGAARATWARQWTPCSPPRWWSGMTPRLWKGLWLKRTSLRCLPSPFLPMWASSIQSPVFWKCLGLSRANTGRFSFWMKHTPCAPGLAAARPASTWNPTSSPWAKPWAVGYLSGRTGCPGRWRRLMRSSSGVLTRTLPGWGVPWRPTPSPCGQPDSR